MDVRTQILTQATRLFAERGYDGTSVREIAEAVGYDTIYHFSAQFKKITGFSPTECRNKHLS